MAWIRCGRSLFASGEGSWKDGSHNNVQYGSKLDIVVTWTLTPVEGCTRLRMVHAGFCSPGNDFTFGAMGSGWGRMLTRSGQVTAEQAQPRSS